MTEESPVGTGSPTVSDVPFDNGGELPEVVSVMSPDDWLIPDDCPNEVLSGSTVLGPKGEPEGVPEGDSKFKSSVVTPEDVTPETVVGGIVTPDVFEVGASASRSVGALGEDDPIKSSDGDSVLKLEKEVSSGKFVL